MPSPKFPGRRAERYHQGLAALSEASDQNAMRAASCIDGLCRDLNQRSLIIL
jgi:hypothetical protein